MVAGLLVAAILLTVLVAVVSSAGYLSKSRALHQFADAQRARALAQVDALRKAEISQVPYLIEGLKPFRDEIVPQVRQLLQQQELSEKERLRLSLAMVAEDESQVTFLSDRLLKAEPAELLVIRDALLPHRDELAAGMWRTVEDPAVAKDRRFRAACVLAAFDPASLRWKEAGNPAAEALVAENPLVAVTWAKALRPVRQSLLPVLQAIFRDHNRHDHDRNLAAGRDYKRCDSERSLAAGILADYAADSPDLLADLLADAELKHFPVFLAALRGHGEQAIAGLSARLSEKPTDDMTDSQEWFARRRANLAIALLFLGQPDPTWSLLRHAPDPSARSWIVHRLAPLGADPRIILRRLDEEKDISARRALILCLGEFGPDHLPAAGRDALVPRLLTIYRDDPDPGMHGAAEWLLRQWKQEGKFHAIDRELATSKVDSRLAAPALGGLGSAANDPREFAKAGNTKQWYINGQGQTMVILPGPVEFLMGHMIGEVDGFILHRKRIPRSLAIASKEVTVAQFKRFMPDSVGNPDCPISVPWYKAAGCRSRCVALSCPPESCRGTATTVILIREMSPVNASRQACFEGRGRSL